MAVPRYVLDSATAELGAYKEFAYDSVKNVLMGVISESGGLPIDDAGDIAFEAIREACMMVAPNVGLLNEEFARSFGFDSAEYLVPDNGEGEIRKRLLSVLSDAKKENWNDARIIDHLSREADFAIQDMHLSGLQKMFGGRGVKWRRVPSGGDTCGFCMMLAGKGSVYKSAKSAGSHYHAHCDCRVVPDGDGIKSVAGFNSENVRLRCRKCEFAIVGDAKYKWEMLSKAERSSYGSISDYIEKLTIAEISRRNPKWVLDGIVEHWLKEKGAEPLPKEKKTANRLTANGFKVLFRKTRSNEHKRTSDIYIGNEAWEIKQPSGEGKQTICHQFEEAAGQSSRLVLDISNYYHSDGRWTYETVVDEVRRRINRQYKSKSGEFVLFDEVLIVEKDGKVTRIKREG